MKVKITAIISMNEFMNKFIVFIFILTINISFGQTKSQLKLIDKFKSCTNDSLFILKHSDKLEYHYNIENTRGNKLSESEELVFQTNIGDVVGPFETDSFYIWLKIERVDSSLKMRVGNIWINYKTIGWDSANARAKSIYTKSSQGASFDSLCKQYTDDSNEKVDCDLGWFWEYQMVPEFSNEIRKHKIGDVFMVKTNYGWHVVKILATTHLDKRQVHTWSLYLKKTSAKN